jgi:hypothetical protein
MSIFKFSIDLTERLILRLSKYSSETKGVLHLFEVFEELFDYATSYGLEIFF